LAVAAPTVSANYTLTITAVRVVQKGIAFAIRLRTLSETGIQMWPAGKVHPGLVKILIQNFKALSFIQYMSAIQKRTLYGHYSFSHRVVDVAHRAITTENMIGMLQVELILHTNIFHAENAVER